MKPGTSVFFVLMAFATMARGEDRVSASWYGDELVEVEQLRVKNLIHMVLPRLTELFHLAPASSLEIPEMVSR